MLSHILRQIPHCVSTIYCVDLLPLVSHTKYIVDVNNELAFVNIAQYFALIEYNKLFHHCIIANNKLAYEGFKHISNDAFVRLFIDLDYTKFDVVIVINIIESEKRYHSILEPLVKVLLRYYPHPIRNYNYLHKRAFINGYHMQLFDIIDLPEEIDYVLNSIQSDRAETLCDQLLTTSGSRIRNMNKSTLSNILSKVSRRKHNSNIFHILYAIVYNKPYLNTVNTNNIAVIFIQKLYGKSCNVEGSIDYNDINMLEPLLTTEDSKLLLVDMLRFCKATLSSTSPNVHEVLVRVAIKYGKLHYLNKDNCEYCKRIVSI